MATATKKKPAAPTIEPRNWKNDTFETIDVALIEISPENERKDFDEEAIEALAGTIAIHGLIEPLVVRPKGTLGFELVAGERRLRAIRLLGWQTVDAKIASADDRQAAAMRIIENLHRVDLNAIEEAAGYRALIDQHGYTQDQLGDLLECKQSTISNAIRMLKLPENWQRRIITGEIPKSHSRVLLKYTDSPRVLAAIEDEFFNDGVECQDIGTREQFTEVCDDVAQSVTRPVGSEGGAGGPNLVWSVKLGRNVQPFDPTPDQCDQLELIELGNTVRAANLELWRELQDAHEAELIDDLGEIADRAHPADHCENDLTAEAAEDGEGSPYPEDAEPMLRHPDEPRANEHGVLDTDVESIEIPFPKSHRCEATIELAQDSRGKWYFGVHASWSNGGFGYAPHWDLEDPIDTRKQAAIAACTALLGGRDGKRHTNDEIGAERYRKVISRFQADVIDKWDDAASPTPPPAPKPADHIADSRKMVDAKSPKKTAVAAEPKERLREDVKVWRANWLRLLLVEFCESSADVCLRAVLLALYGKQAGYNAAAVEEQCHSPLAVGGWSLTQIVARCEKPLEALVGFVPDWLWDRDKNEPSRVLTDTQVEALAEACGINLGEEWKKDLAGRLSEAFFNLHTRPQLEELAHELGVASVLQQINKASMVDKFLADEETKRHLPLVIQPVDLSWHHDLPAGSDEPETADELVPVTKPKPSKKAKTAKKKPAKQKTK